MKYKFLTLSLLLAGSPPIVVYQESVKGSNPSEFEGKSPNKHNKFYFIVSPLEESVKDAIRRNEIDVDSKIKDLVSTPIGLPGMKGYKDGGPDIAMCNHWLLYTSRCV